MIISLCGICVLRFVWLSIAVPLHRDIKTVVVSYPLAWTITSVLFLIYYLFKKKRLMEEKYALVE